MRASETAASARARGGPAGRADRSAGGPPDRRANANVPAKSGSRRVLGRWYHSTGFWLLLLSPALVLLAALQFYPFFDTLRLGFTNKSAAPDSGGFVGLSNFKFLATEDPHFWMIVGNSFVWVLASVVLQLAIGTLAALVLNMPMRLRYLWRGLLMVPWVTPTVVVGLIWRWIFEGSSGGLANFALMHLHITDQPIVFLANDLLVWPVLLFASTWKGVPFVALLVLASLQSVSAELHEAAKVDGANVFQRFLAVTIPHLRPTLFAVGMISLVTTWFKFELIWALTKGGPGYATSILPTYVYTWGFERFDYGMAGAVATLAMLVILLTATAYAALLRERQPRHA